MKIIYGLRGATTAFEQLYIPQLSEKAGENNIFCNAYNEMPCTATDNVFQKKKKKKTLLMAAVMKEKRIKNSDVISCLIQAACCVYHLKFYEQTN